LQKIIDRGIGDVPNSGIELSGMTWSNSLVSGEIPVTKWHRHATVGGDSTVHLNDLVMWLEKL
jgi:hypothetical protein